MASCQARTAALSRKLTVCWLKSSLRHWNHWSRLPIVDRFIMMSTKNLLVKSGISAPTPPPSKPASTSSEPPPTDAAHHHRRSKPQIAPRHCRVADHIILYAPPTLASPYPRPRQHTRPQFGEFSKSQNSERLSGNSNRYMETRTGRLGSGGIWMIRIYIFSSDVPRHITQCAYSCGVSSLYFREIPKPGAVNTPAHFKSTDRRLLTKFRQTLRFNPDIFVRSRRLLGSRRSGFSSRHVAKPAKRPSAGQCWDVSGRMGRHNRPACAVAFCGASSGVRRGCWASAKDPAWGAYSAPADPLAGLKNPTSNGKENK